MQPRFLTGRAFGLILITLSGAITAGAQNPGATNSLPTVTLTATDAQAAEAGPDSGAYAVVRTGPTSSPLTVFFALGGTAVSSDYAPFLTNATGAGLVLGMAATFPAGQSQLSLTVNPIDDQLAEGSETVELRLVQPPLNVLLPAGSAYHIGAPSNAVVVIEDNDLTNNIPQQAVVNIVAVDPQGREIPVVPPGLGMPQLIDSAVFRVSRTGPTHFEMPVLYSVSGTASNGVDYERLSGQITIPVGAQSANLEVVVIDDLLVESTESVIVTLEPIACIAIFPPPPECYQVGTSHRATATILDNDANHPTNLPPVVRITAPPHGAAFHAPADIHIEAETVDPDGYASTVEFFANNVKIGESTLVFIQAPPPGDTLHFDLNWPNVPAGSYTLTCRTRDDVGATAVSSPVTILVGTNNIPGATNSLPVVTIVARDAFASEGTNFFGTNNPAVFVIRRTGATNLALTVSYDISGTAMNGSDYASIATTVTIPAGRRSARVTIEPLEDNLAEPIETVVLALRAGTPAGAVSPYVVGSPGRAAATISDELVRPPCLQLPDHLFHFCLAQTNGFGHLIEAGTNLVDWQVICTNVVVNGAVHFVDPDAADHPNRFFRVSPAPVPVED